MLIDAERLKLFAAQIFRALGTYAAYADMVAEHLVEANLKGHD